MIAAIYSRKSKFTGKGESIENQVQLCTEYAKKLGIKDLLIYEDEGFSGGNVDRPEFQKLLKDAKNKKFDVLICYRLDRISRNIADFSTLIEDLELLDVNFISIREQFDTSTPMGRAMMYIASVFAQLERETIAERVRDNMLELAKSGRWLGGQTPLGFKSEQISYIDSEYKERSMYMLSPIEEELKTVNLIYNKYLEFKSLRKVNQYLLENNYKTKLGANWNVRAVSDLLKNPTYVKADNNVFNYLKSKGMVIIGTPDNIHGILTYNKKKGQNQYRDMDEWIASIAKHVGIIDSDTWLQIQSTLKENKSKAPNLGKTNTTLLTGILRCGKCNAPMTVIHGRKDRYGEKVYYYACSMKIDSKSTRCDNKNVRADELEKTLIAKLKDESTNSNGIIRELTELKNKPLDKQDLELQVKSIEKSKGETKKSIERLVSQIAENPDSVASKYLISEIEKRNSTLEDLELKLKDLIDDSLNKNQVDTNIDIVIQTLLKFNDLIDSVDNSKKKNMISTIVDTVTWDSSNGDVDIKLWGSPKKK